MRPLNSSRQPHYRLDSRTFFFFFSFFVSICVFQYFHLLPKWLTPKCISYPSTVRPYEHNATPALLIRKWRAFSAGKEERLPVIQSFRCSISSSLYVLCVNVWVLAHVTLTVIDLLCKLADRFGVREIQLPGDYFGGLHLPHDVTSSLLSFGHVSAGQNHPSSYKDSYFLIVWNLIQVVWWD